MQPIQGWDYHTEKYREAATKEEQCKADLIAIWGPNPTYDKLPIEEMKKEYHEYCPKSESNNFIFCPKSIIKKRNDVKVQWINDYFKNYGKKSEKKYYKKKSTKKYSGKKNTKKYYGKKSTKKYNGKKSMKKYNKKWNSKKNTRETGTKWKKKRKSKNRKES